jgi:hypothetical protein
VAGSDDTYARAFRTDADGFYRIGVSGTPDIDTVVHGKYVGIEVKDAKGRLNDNKIDFGKRLMEAGGTYIVARSLDDVIRAFNTGPVNAA